MNGVFIDSNVFLLLLEEDANAKNLLLNLVKQKYELFKNSIVFSEVLYTVLRAVTGLKPFELKKKGFVIDNEILRRVIKLLDITKSLELNEKIEILSLETMQKYNLLPNDALIAATCKYYGISKIATFDEDFEKVDFLEVVKV